eukprot:jgi/Antlo1/732/166
MGRGCLHVDSASSQPQSLKMGLSTMIRKIKKERGELKMLILGLDNSGKTTILHKQFGLVAEYLPPTFGYRIHSIQHGPWSLLFLDVGGQQSFRKYWTNYYEGLDGLVYVFDLTDPRPVSSHLESIVNDHFLCDVPVLILGNKLDLCDSTEQIKCDFVSGLESSNVKFTTCSAVSGENLDVGFRWLISKASDRLLTAV